MANSTSSGRKAKVDENNNGRCVSETSPINSGSSMKDATGPRRSNRETSSKKMTPSPSSIRKSERLGKSTSLNPVVRRKSERVERQKMISPLRRSKRTQNHSDLASLGSKSSSSLSSISKQKKKKKHKSVKKLTFEAEKEEHEVGTSHVRKRMDARAYRAMIKKKPKTDCPEVSNSTSNLIQEGDNNDGDKIDDCSTRNHLDCKEVSKNGMLPSDDAKELVNLSAIEDRGEIEATLAAEICENGIDCLPSKDTSTEMQTDDGKICLICKCGGQLIFCDGKDCGGCYHVSCLEPYMVDAPFGVWHCHLCLKKKIESGVYSVSEGVESILDAIEVKVSRADGWTTEKHFLVKFKGLAHVHSRCVPESQLLLEAPSLLLEKFNQKDQALGWKLEWSLPHRLLQKRALIFAQQNGDPRSGQAVDYSDCHYEWLVKWHGLGYEHASWELDNASFLRSLEGQRLIKDYEDRHQRAKRVPLFSKVDKKLEPISSFSKLSQTPGGFPPGFGINNLDAVNKLREHWHKGQDAIVFDDHDRMVKVVAFIISLDSSTCRPFLIISTSAALHLWEDEFSRWVPSLNVVVYGGNKEIRRSIRKLEFYGEGGCLLFQVLIVLSEIIIEDLEVFGGIEWEAIIVDECQCSKISSYLKQIKILKTDLWILLLRGQLEESAVEYHNILALLDPQSYEGDNDELVSNSSDIDQLKHRLSSFVAYRCKSNSFRFVEYWIPVKISNVQLEQYCATLLSNSSTLRSQSKTHVVGALRDILITTRKCCNHPYLVDESLQTLLIKDLPPAEILDVGVKASGKLQLLDSMLMELKKQGLRVLILFQLLGGSGKVSIGDILDDLIRQRFGPDSYERIDKCVLHSKKQSALKMFNNKDHGRFVFLLETNACHHSIRLSSVDAIIIFDSDWYPLNDIRSLQRITFDSRLEQIKIFRLYSSFTVEERALVLAKQDKPLDSKLDISWSTSHTLLMWGASSLFDDLRAFHDGKTDVSSVNFLSGQLLLQQALREFSYVLKQCGEDNDTRDYSFLLKVQQNGVKYHTNFSLLGELKFRSLDLEASHLFWTKVLEAKSPQWKYCCCLSQRSRKRVQLFDGSGNRPELENEDVVKKRAKLINNVVDQPYSKIEGENLSIGNKEGNSGESVERPQGNDVEFEKARKLRDEQKRLHLSLKSDIPKIYEVLHVPDKVKRMADEFLEYVMNNHNMDRISKSILEAFQISLCWTAASWVKHKIDRKASLMLARQHLKFDCTKDQAEMIYSMLRCLKTIFFYRTGNYNVTGSPKASDSELSGKNYSCTDLAPEVELALKDDVSKCIKEIQKKCQKKLRKLDLKHQEEKKKLEATYKEEMSNLDNKYKIESAVIRSCSPNDVMKTEKLKALDIEYTRRIEDLTCQHRTHLNDLENVQSMARQKFQDREASWVGDVKSWAHDELLSILPSKEHGNGIEYSKTSEQAEPDNDPKNMCSVSSLVAVGTNFDKIVEAKTGTRVELSKTPEIISPMTKLCSNPVEVRTLPVEAGSANEGHHRAPNACDSQGKIIYVQSCFKEQNANGATCMMNEGEGHKNVFNDGCREKTVPDGSEKDITMDPPPSKELISSREGYNCGSEKDITVLVGALNVSDRELSSRPCGNPPLTEQQTLDGVSLRIHDGHIPMEVPETSHETDECYNCGRDRTDVVLDKTASDEQNRMSRVMNCNTLSQELQDSHASSLTSPRMVDKDATVEEIQPAKQLSSPVDVFPTSQSIPASVLEPPEQVQQLPSAESLAFHQDPAGEMQISAQQVEAVSSPVDVLSAGQTNHDSVREPVEQLQPLPSAELLASNLDTAGEMLNSSKLVEPACSQIDVAPAGGLNHASLVREPLQLVQQLPSAESLASHQDTAGEKQILAQQVEAVSSPVDALPAGQSNHDSVRETVEQLQQLPSAESLASNLDNAVEMLNSSQQVEPACCQVDVAPANGLDHEPLVREPLQQIQQLRHAESPNSNFPLATGIELQSNNEDSLSGHVSQASMEVTNHAVVQPASNSELDSHAPFGAIRTQSLDTRNVFTPSEINNHLRQTTTQSVNRMLPPLFFDPLKNELDRLHKESDQTMKYYEDMKLQLKSDCEREIEEIRRKYDIKLQESEVEFQLKKKNLDTSLNLVLMNKIWAEAFRSKCMDLKVSGASGMQQDASFAQQLVWLSRQQRDIRPPLVTSPPCRPPASTLQHFTTTASSQTMVPPPASTVQHFSTTASSQIMVTPLPTIASSTPMVPPISTATSSQTMAPPLQAAYNTSGICSSASARPPHINTIIPPVANHLAGCGFRATPPHLQPFRPSTSVPDACFPTPTCGISSQQAPNIPAIPSLPHHPRPTLPTYISDPHNRVRWPEIPVGLSTPNLEPAMDGNSHLGINLPNTLLRSSNVASLQQSEFGSNSSMQDNSTHQAMPADIVCLSDDD